MQIRQQQFMFFCRPTLALLLGLCGSTAALAEDYDYETSNRIVMKGEILHAGQSDRGSTHFFTVKYKGKLFFCHITQRFHKCSG